VIRQLVDRAAQFLQRLFQARKISARLGETGIPNRACLGPRAAIEPGRLRTLCSTPWASTPETPREMEPYKHGLSLTKTSAHSRTTRTPVAPRRSCNICRNRPLQRPASSLQNGGRPHGLEVDLVSGQKKPGLIYLECSRMASVIRAHLILRHRRRLHLNSIWLTGAMPASSQHRVGRADCMDFVDRTHCQPAAATFTAFIQDALEPAVVRVTGALKQECARACWRTSGTAITLAALAAAHEEAATPAAAGVKVVVSGSISCESTLRHDARRRRADPGRT